MKRLNILIISYFFLQSIIAQDIHFSQFALSPLNLNPAESGLFDGEFRLTANHRNQWKAITTPYKTLAASFDWNIKKKILPKGTLGTGLQVLTDVAGDGNFGTQIIRWSAAWHVPLSDSSWTASLGLNINYNQYNIDFSRLYYGNQYNGYSYDPDLPSNEFFEKNRFSFADFSLGGIIKHTLKNGVPLHAGFALTHINQPSQSFNEWDENQLAQKFNFDIKSVLKINKEWCFLPSIAYYRQSRFNELYYGGLLQFYTRNISFKHIYFGGWFRHGDAGILKIGFDYQNVNVGFSYDLNFSSLRVTSRGRGGPEIGIVYIFSRPKPLPVLSKKTCPVFL